MNLQRDKLSLNLAMMSPDAQETALNKLVAYAEGYAEFSMRTLGRVPPSLLAITPGGSFHFIPASLKDVDAKDDFAYTSHLICTAYGVTVAVVISEVWMKTAKPGEKLDLDEAPSEAFDRQEVVIITGEAVDQHKQRLLPIIRTGAGGFFGFGEHDGPKFDSYEGRFAQMIPPKKPTDKEQKMAKVILAAMGITEQSLRNKPEWN